ncbi:beta-ketoacyl synthase N-terminal-like domain-containing protein [Streptomyces lonegramiae]|uniref:Beta-ketoacyl synthase N-terminal-like domain-containing protein n=1 Tax=Streptomyces lonegramiae TaxID=3075524 RepID=A0ABU2XNP1_9ACTN|nr:beta-ketoacyl synthase N-terminal-like domain-containing protein [Streptomyces sp. DSM 41529]MDT0547552.1 beta-ketoacyl synthase N-terminal-like domain-containing protein [Streptomyces sp. DSM 41529]
MTVQQEDQSIAVIGMACRFPGADDTERYWARLVGAETSVVRLTDGQLRARGVPEDTLSNPRYVPVAGLLDGIDLFDAEYFGIAPAEAAAMDPQHRLFLQESVHALEHAGLARYGPDRRVGVFCGAGENRYAALLPSPESGARTHRSMSDTPAALPLRVSYHLDLRGPSVYVNSLCSTALTAVHLARRSLLAGECDIALAGAVSLQLPQQHGYQAVDGSAMSPDGELRPFDRSATGTVPGSGVGVVVLKGLAQALRDGDTVHAVLRGSALNNDGAERQSFAAPSVRGQRDVVLAALADAGIDPATVGYVEAHGTGTPLGDPIELAALREAREHLGVTAPCAVGAVKSSVGHLDTAAGMAGIIKAVLAVREGVVPATVGHGELNPDIRLDGSGLYISTRTHPWPLTSHPRRAAVTALGMGGSNAHIVLEQPPATPSTPRHTGDDSGAGPWTPQIFPLSAHTPASFDRLREQLAQAVTAAPHPPSHADVALTLQRSRNHRRLRWAWVAPTLGALDSALREGSPPLPRGPVVLGIGFRDKAPQTAGASPAALLPRLRAARERPGPGALEERAAWTGEEFRTACGALESLAALGAVPDALAALDAGEYAAFAAAGALPWDVALRCALYHAQAVEAALDGGDLDACEELLGEIQAELAAVRMSPPAYELRSLTLGSTLPAGAAPPPGHLLEVTRSAVMGPAEAGLPAGVPNVADAVATWEDWLTLVAHCWERGCEVSWELLPGPETARRTSLPLYPFDAVRHWGVAAAPAPVPESPPPSAVPESPAPSAAPTGDTMTELAAMWRAVLGVPEVRPDDSFFALGGHSLVASQVMVRIRERFDVRVSLGDLLEAETLAGMAELVDEGLTSMRVYAALTSTADDRMGTVEL